MFESEKFTLKERAYPNPSEHLSARLPHLHVQKSEYTLIDYKKWISSMHLMPSVSNHN